MSLHYLDFDYSEDEAGHGSFDAIASALPPQQPALEAEVLRVLEWAEREFPGARGPLDEGGEWDYALQGVREVATPLEVTAAEGRLRLTPREPDPPRLTLSLTLTGSPQFGAAFRAAFGIG